MNFSFSRRGLRVVVLTAILTVSPALLRAYVLNGRYSPNGNIVMQLQLGTPPSTLSDGATAWSTPAISALNEWNAQMVRCQFTTVVDSTAAKDYGNSLNNVYFSPTVNGDAWGSSVLAVTLSYRSSLNFTTEADVLFNTGYTWNSYRGALQRSGGVTTHDFRRIALHEFGHALGLGHPDTASPAQFVGAVMNSTVSDTDTLQTDDISGVKVLYGTQINPPDISSNPVSRTMSTTGSFTFALTATGTGPFTYSWVYFAPGSNTAEIFRLAQSASYTIGAVEPGDAGNYYGTAANLAGYVTSSRATLTVNPVSVSASSRLTNISTRGVVGTGDGILITGFVIAGTTNKTVIIRAAGPALTGYGVPGALVDPSLEIVRQSTGAIVATNDNWETGNNVAALNAQFQRLGAFAFASGSKDAAVMATLPPGVYSAKLSGVGGTTGVALVEAYDADPDTSTALTRKLLNISTRGQVGTVDNVLIAGLVVDGPAPRRFLVRAVGPSLATYGVTGALDDPFLQILDANNNVIRENDDWDTPGSGQQALTDAANAVGASPLQVRRDSCLIITLQPGKYTAKVSGFGGITGVALVEVYELPN
jgi:hypothetical protein